MKLIKIIWLLLFIWTVSGCAGNRTTETRTYIDPVLNVQVTETFINDTWTMWSWATIENGEIEIFTPGGRVVKLTIKDYARGMDAEGIRAVGESAGNVGKAVVIP